MSSLDEIFPHSGWGVQDRNASLGSTGEDDPVVFAWQDAQVIHSALNWNGLQYHVISTEINYSAM